MSEVKRCENCGNEQIQILNYKGDYLCGICGRDTERMHEIEHDAEVRAKAIDEFVEKFIFKAVCEGCSGCCNCYEEGRQSECEDWKAYMEIAEQMKGGAK